MTVTTDQIQAIIFDMDGLLVDSEPCWQKAEMEVFAKVGISLTLDMCLETTGKPIEDVIQYWYHKSPWDNPDFGGMKQELLQITTRFIETDALLMPGVHRMIHLAEKKNWKTGLASASPIAMIETVLRKFSIIQYFDFYHSAELEEFNKPHPAVYLTVARNLGIDIRNCLIMEDSGNGVKGALASGAQVAAVPSPHDFHLPVFDNAQVKVKSLPELHDLLS